MPEQSDLVDGHVMDIFSPSLFSMSREVEKRQNKARKTRQEMRKKKKMRETMKRKWKDFHSSPFFIFLQSVCLCDLTSLPLPLVRFFFKTLLLHVVSSPPFLFASLTYK